MLENSYRCLLTLVIVLFIKAVLSDSAGTLFCSLCMKMIPLEIKNILHYLLTFVDKASSFTTVCEKENEFTSQDGTASLPATTCAFVDDSAQTLSTSLICDNPDVIRSTECPPNLLFSRTALNYWVEENEQNISTSTPPEDVKNQNPITPPYKSQFTILSDAILPHNNDLPPSSQFNLTQMHTNFYTVDERWFRLMRKKNCSSYSDAFSRKFPSRSRRTPIFC